MPEPRAEQTLADYVIDTLEEVVEMTGGLDRKGATVVLDGLRQAWAQRDEARTVVARLMDRAHPDSATWDDLEALNQLLSSRPVETEPISPTEQPTSASHSDVTGTRRDG